MNVTYGKEPGKVFTIDSATLPETSVKALLSRGLSHFLGNEQASKVAAKKEAFKAETGNDAADDEVAAWKEEFQAAAIAALEAGTVGVRAPSAPRLDPIESVIRRFAKAEVLAVLKNANLKAPVKDETIEIGGNAFTMEDLISRRISKEGERLTKEAKKHMDAEARRAKQAAEQGGLEDVL